MCSASAEHSTDKYGTEPPPGNRAGRGRRGHCWGCQRCRSVCLALRHRHLLAERQAARHADRTIHERSLRTAQRGGPERAATIGLAEIQGLGRRHRICGLDRLPIHRRSRRGTKLRCPRDRPTPILQGNHRRGGSAGPMGGNGRLRLSTGWLVAQLDPQRQWNEDRPRHQPQVEDAVCATHGPDLLKWFKDACVLWTCAEPYTPRCRSRWNCTANAANRPTSSASRTSRIRFT